MTDDVKPSGAPVSAHGTEPTTPSDGQGPTPSDLWSLLLRQADIIESLVAQNHDLMSMALNDVDEPDEGHGVDMAGNPIRVS